MATTETSKTCFCSFAGVYIFNKNKNKNKNKRGYEPKRMIDMKIIKGFSLLELILALGIGTAISFIKFQDMKAEQENIIAQAVGEQIKQIGEAVNLCRLRVLIVA